MTYVNYPSTEYLRLPFLDVVCFNVYLESAERFGAYLARYRLLISRPLQELVDELAGAPVHIRSAGEAFATVISESR